MKRLPAQYRNSYVRRERDRRALGRQLLLLVGGLLITVGFVVALKLHFAAVRYGYQTEELRRERARLLEEQQQLELELSEVASPTSLAGAARQLGLQPARPTQIEPRRGEAPQTMQPATAVLVGRHAGSAFRR